MSESICFWCHSDRVVTVDPEGDGCCGGCAPLLDPDAQCGHCDSEAMPIKMLGLWPACAKCLGDARRQPVTPIRERIEGIAREAGVAGDIWSMSLLEFAAAVADAKCVKLGLVRARDPQGIAKQAVANEVGQ